MAGVLKHSEVPFQEDSRGCGFGNEIHWFYVEERPVHGKKIYGFQKYQISLGCGLKQYGN